VFLPAALNGLILAGIHPVDGVLVQAVVMLFVGAVATNATVIAIGLVARLFTRDDRPIRLVRMPPS
jgi:putative ABC transport system permease protein